MAREEITAEELRCDGCDKTVMVTLYDDEKGWFSGDARQAGAGVDGEWDACSRKCIQKAVLAALGDV